MKSILLTQGYSALVDDSDFERVNAFKWCAVVHRTKNHMRVYASRSGRNANGERGKIYMHRFIMECSEDVDHHDRDGLNNQRYNLRRCNHSQNQANSSKPAGCSSDFKGVSWSEPKGKWRAAVYKDGERLHLGYFRDECDAAQAYNFAALEIHGEFAAMNTPKEEL